MFSPTQLPTVSGKDVSRKIHSGETFFLLDVREPWELLRATLGEWVINIPLSKLAELGTAAFPPAITVEKESQIIVMCHHGIRSAQVTAWMRQQGWTQVYNMAGGIDDYALTIDDQVGRY